MFGCPRAFCRSIAAAIALIALCAPVSLAQHRVETWTTERGLPQNSITDIVQTRDGYLWLATYGGLVRFDGVRFTVFDTSTDGIKGQRFSALHQARDGTLWAGADDGMLVRYRGGRFVTYTASDGLPGDFPYRIEEDENRVLWITWTRSVTSFDGSRFVSYRTGDLARGVVPPPDPRICELWWNLDAAGLHVFVGGRVETYTTPEWLADGVTGVNRDGRGNLWIRTRSAGVLKVHGERAKRYTARDGLPAADPQRCFYEDHAGAIWLSDASDNVFRIKHGTRELMNTSGLLRFYEDREHSVWLGTNEGLHQVRDSSIAIYSERNGLSQNWVYSILQNPRGTIWIGTWGGGVNKLEGGRVTAYDVPGLGRGMVTCIYEDRSHVVGWIVARRGWLHDAVQRRAVRAVQRCVRPRERCRVRHAPGSCRYTVVRRSCRARRTRQGPQREAIRRGRRALARLPDDALRG